LVGWILGGMEKGEKMQRENDILEYLVGVILGEKLVGPTVFSLGPPKRFFP